MICLDTYPLVEIIKGNPKFSGLLNVDFIIPDLTMAEFFLVILKKYDEQTAKYWLKKLKPFCKNVELETLINSMVFRHKNKKLNLSIIDSVGYVFSRENKMLFVTGDKAFKNLPGVKFLTK